MRILLFSNFDLPISCANATRMWSMAKILRNKGHKVEILGISYNNQNETLEGEYYGFKYRMIKAQTLSGIHALKRTRDISRKIRIMLDELTQKEKIDAIILSNVYYDFLKVFIDFSKRKKVFLALNVVEWYDINNDLFKGIYGKIRFIQNRIALKYLYVKVKNIIAISELLGNYYKNRHCNTIVIPTIIDLNDYSNLSKTNNKKLIISYAGSPAKKDYISNVIKAILKLDIEERKKLEIHLYGISNEELIKLGINKININDLSNCLFCHDRIPYEKVKNKIASSDFTILLRPNKRYANAGFPTKIGESMASGTPVIANLTSDIGKYLTDGFNGLVCDNETVDACYNSLIRAIDLSDIEKEEMRKNALSTAKNSFDISNYVEILEQFLEYNKGVTNEKK